MTTSFARRKDFRVFWGVGFVEAILSGVVLVTPVLLHNLRPEYSRDSLIALIHALPDGALARTIPIAQAVTIARVASKISTNRIYQTLVLQSLKAFFEKRKCLILQGDIIAVKVDLEQRQLLDALVTEEEDPSELPGEQCVGLRFVF